MEKAKFFRRLLVLATACVTVLAAVFYKRYSKYPVSSLALVHLSSSISYNSNIQNLAAQTNFSNVEYMIMGSSISLNNISAKMIEDSTGKKTYNLSSWGFPLKRTIDFFSVTRPQHCRNVFVGFTNIDFRADSTIAYDFPLSKYYLGGNSTVQLLVILKTFNFLQFDNDSKYKDSVIKRSALDFDVNGSALLDPARFPRDDKKLPVYRDTTGFHLFLENTLRLKNLLKELNCHLTMVYMPYRKDILSKEQMINCNQVAAELDKALGTGFVDLHSQPLADSLYWDGAHLYKTGALQVTQQLLGAINTSKKD